MKLKLESKHFIIFGAISVLGLMSSVFIGKSISSTQVKLYKANSGIGVCHQRVIQTFTAVMIKDLSSNYLKNDFKDMTSECFNEVSEMISGIVSNGEILSTLNGLKSDLHWFHQKIARVVNLSQKDNIDLGQSNLMEKYVDLEDLSSKLEESILFESNSLENSSLLNNLLASFSVFLLIASSIGIVLFRRVQQSLESKKRSVLETQASELSIDDQMKAKIASLESYEDQEVLLTYIEKIVKEKNDLEDRLIQMNTEGEFSSKRYEIELAEEGDLVHDIEVPVKSEIEVTDETVGINNIINLVLDRLQGRIHEQGIILHTDTKDDYLIYGEQENIQQVMYSLINYGIDCLASIDEAHRNLKLTSKALGGIAYCKVAISNYKFSDAERSILSTANSAVEDVSLNLTLLRELLQDSGLSYSLKNRQNSQKGTFESEIEIIFERADDTKEYNDVKVVKGSKTDIRKYFDGQL